MSKTNKLDFLLALYITAIVVAELMGSKIFTINNLINSSVGIFALPITFTINDIVAEVYGKSRAQSFVKAGAKILVILALYILFVLVLPPATRFTHHQAYQTVFHRSLRITLASLVAFWLSERLDVLIFTKVKAKLNQHGLWLRNNLSNTISMLFDTTIFMFLAFYKPGSSAFIISIIWPYWLLKCAYSALHTPFTYLGVNWLKQ